MASCRLRFRVFLWIFLGIFSFMFLLAIQIMEDDSNVKEKIDEILSRNEQHLGDRHAVGKERAALSEDIPYPIILWWTHFTVAQGNTKTCGEAKCFLTTDKHYKNHAQTKVFLFYGSDFKVEDLPLPRKPHHEWALLHEESPKNQFLFSHQEVMSLFNHTATFKRQSDYPITTQYLDGIETLKSKKYWVTTEQKNLYLGELAMMNYVQSDCDTPSDRDHLVRMLSRHIKIDSYGACEHNKDLPKHLTDPIKGMEHSEFYELMAKYKFTLVAENAICDDYITEKLWRPLMLGSVPIVWGSPKVKDFLPDSKSVILVSDFKSVEDLAQYISFLNINDEEYEKYLSFKRLGVRNTYLLDTLKNRDWGTSNEADKQNFVDGFECFVCKRLHENQKRQAEGEPPIVHIAKKDHYGCPRPLGFSDSPTGSLRQVIKEDMWDNVWVTYMYMAKALRHLIDRGKVFSEKTLQDLAAALNLQDEQLGLIGSEDQKLEI